MPELAGAVRDEGHGLAGTAGRGGVRDTTLWFRNGFGWWTAQRRVSPSAAA